MKFLKAIFAGVGSVALGAIVMIVTAVLAAVALALIFNLTGWELLFAAPFLLVAGIFIALVVNSIIYTIIYHVIEHKAKKAKAKPVQVVSTIE